MTTSSRRRETGQRKKVKIEPKIEVTETRDISPAQRGYICAAVCCLLMVAPYLAVTFPPIYDLPQQVAQIRLFLENLGQANPLFQTIWIAPNKLSYLVLGIFWAIFPPLYAGKAAMLAMGILWVLTAHALAVRYNRPSASAALASMFAFNQVFYWGFYSFVVGWPVFVFWLVLTTREPSTRSKAWPAALFLLTALLLYLSHALWFAAGMLWLVIYSAVFRPGLKRTLFILVSIAPVILLAAVWYIWFDETAEKMSAFTTEAIWSLNLMQRLSAQWVVDSGLGGLNGWIEIPFMTAAAAWVLVSLRQNRHKPYRGANLQLLTAAGMFFILSYFLPDQYQISILMSMRWMPCALILLVMALPAPEFHPKLRLAAALVVLASFCAITTGYWVDFEKKEMSGFQEVIAGLPENPRVLGLDFVKFSSVVKGRPFIQTFAYAQVVHGGELSFSFAEHASSLVTYREGRREMWSRGLDWYAEKVKDTDLKYFSHVIINASPEDHDHIVRGEPIQVNVPKPDFKVNTVEVKIPDLLPLTLSGRWRLYEVTETAWTRRK